MFTGIIRGVGQVAQQTDVGGDRRITIDTEGIDLATLSSGDSVAVNGVCLTVVETTHTGFSADVSVETLGVTTYRELSVGSGVNLEPALRMGDSLDGHLLTGHVDGVGQVLEVQKSGRSVTLRLEVNAELAHYIARKGAVAVDGVSLTVNAVENTAFTVNIVPHTQEKTIIPRYKPGTAVNIEVDIIARYVERLASSRAVSTGVSLELLQKHGYTSTD